MSVNAAVKYLVWAAALAFAIGIAVLLYALAGFGRLGSRAGLEAATHAVAAFAIGMASQLGLGLAPLVRWRALWLRAVATGLMVPAMVFGIAMYADVLGRAPEHGARSVDHPVVFLYLAMVPVHLAVLVWMWRGPRPEGGLAGPPRS